MCRLGDFLSHKYILIYANILYVCVYQGVNKRLPKSVEEIRNKIGVWAFIKLNVVSMHISIKRNSVENYKHAVFHWRMESDLC